MKSELFWLRNHLTETLGADVTEVNCGDALRVFAWNQGNSDVLVTLGMSTREQFISPASAASPNKNPRSELLMISDAQFRQASCALLADLAEYPFTHHTFLYWFHFMPLGRAVVKNSQLTSVLFTMPCVGSSEFWTARSPQSQRVDLLQVIPISEAEREYCKSNGVERLEELFETSNLDIGDFLRSSIV